MHEKKSFLNNGDVERNFYFYEEIKSGFYTQILLWLKEVT